MKEKIIETYNLTKVYQLKGKSKVIALNKINLSIDNGEIFGLLGPNGAGKTTLISILATLIQPTSGYATIFGENILKSPNKIRKRISLMLGNDLIYYRITGYDNLKYFCKLYKVKNYNEKIWDLAKKFEIADWLNEYVEYYSQGMKLRVALLRALLTEPDVLFLDEPILGLDPKAVKYTINFLKGLDKTIFVTSHQMNFIKQFCDRIGFINKGELIHVDSFINFSKILSNKIKIKIEIKENIDDLIKELNSQSFIHEVISNDDGIIVKIKDLNNYPMLMKLVGNYSIRKVQEIEDTLEDIFIKLAK